MPKTIPDKLFQDLLEFCNNTSTGDGDEPDNLYQQLLEIQTEQDIKEMNDATYPEPKKQSAIIV